MERAIGWNGGVIREKTLLAWVTIDSHNARGGSVIGIDNIAPLQDNFDSIVFAERQKWRWMASAPMRNGTPLGLVA